MNLPIGSFERIKMLLYISLFVVTLLSFYFLYNLYNKPQPKIERKNNGPPKKETIRIRIFYGSTSGVAKSYAKKFFEELEYKNGVKVSMHNLEKFNTEDWETMNEKQERLVFFVGTGEKGGPPDSCKRFFEELVDHRKDFRVSKYSFRNIKYIVVGVGNSDYGEKFCKFAQDLDNELSELSGKKIARLLGDVKDDRIETQYQRFLKRVMPLILGIKQLPPDKKVFKKEQDEEEKKDYFDDIEELEAEGMPTSGEMINEKLGNSLRRQGYKLVGTHSVVKLCRWTKSMLRGRGGCYKHTAYNINSSQCMEMSPAIACANRCVFCWRHNTHPTSKEWRWKVDEPEDIVEEAIKKHQAMIYSMKGAEGVTEKKLQKGMTVKHCALSLIGEPITYPRINELMDSLHKRGISSFLVTNPQFPEALQNLKMITQLYVSIDAPTKEEWDKVTRPVFEDGWERFLACLDIIKNKQARSVYRLTLVKNWNMDQLEAYKKLIERGEPCFIEIKGVTFCGFTTSNLTMDNVPYHEEVRKFCEALADILDDYEIACEHEHSHLVLLSHKKFKIKNEWHTWIDYPKFIELSQSKKDFGPMDYIEKTPSWALYNSKEQGFDPEEIRIKKVKSK